MNTTISISTEMKEKIRSLGRAGESYDDIIRRMYDLTSADILKSYLYDESDSQSIDEAIAEAKRRWPKSA